MCCALVTGSSIHNGQYRSFEALYLELFHLVNHHQHVLRLLFNEAI